MSTITYKRAFSLTALALASGIALSACASGPSSMPGMDHGSTPMSSGTASASDPNAAFNDADVMFAQMMIPHHEQAVEMSDAVLAKPGLDPRVAKIAEQIKAAQAPEIETLKGWLNSWGQPTTMSGGMSGMDGMSMDGMASAEDLEKLRGAEPAEAAELFLTQMIAHHEGAVAMAQTEKTDGKNADAVAMAGSIVDSQTKEIDEMKSLLGQL